MKIKKKGIVSIVVAVIIAGTIGILNISKSKYLSVQATRISQGNLKAYLSTTGVIKSQDMKKYYGPQAKVSKVNIKVGDKVKKGDILITYAVENLNTLVKQAELQYNNSILQKRDLENQNAEINNKLKDKNNQIEDIEKKIEDINNQIETLKNSILPSASIQVQGFEWQKSTLEQQKTILVQQKNAVQPISNEKLKQADNAVNLAKLNLKVAKENLSKSIDKIVATNDGVVTTLNAVEGSVENMTQPVAVVQNTENLKVVLSVGKYDANNVKLNQTAIIKSSKKQYKGKVTYIAPAAEKSKDPTSGDTTLTVEVSIIDKNPDLKIDFDVDTEILLAEAQNVIKVPTECIKTDKRGKNFIYVIKDNKVIGKEIQLGIESDNEAEIIKGAAVGEQVILNPTDKIKNETLVNVSSDINSIKTKRLFFFK
ncbi:efflux RND transporter periplasmic adaptor subunit [Clostridium ganghwense]|uniref:HlyD family efflux transporter periplasmic adaptor subunit n=1 Tax=Clostridium ganghwense TaxID=312089 RepID=A0ABT4CRG0_9CLOT|nr:HlyD family efflux transporter periplasmic adaptor subunit [Clostridium ganghwense]MCY6371663.1 HlyD family efflux transporter periplasmic adaptor subunit [Clostridium ganghwense]